MYTRVTIIGGMLCRHNLQYPLTAEDGTPAPVRDYSGDAWLADGKLVIGADRASAAVEVWLVGEATPESVLWADGFAHGEKQKRCSWPNGKPAPFVDGWRQAWSERGGLPTKFVEVGGKVISEASARRNERRAGG